MSVAGVSVFDSAVIALIGDIGSGFIPITITESIVASMTVRATISN
jgi:hypothetical protein